MDSSICRLFIPKSSKKNRIEYKTEYNIEYKIQYKNLTQEKKPASKLEILVKEKKKQ